MTTPSPHVWDPESLARTSGSCLGNQAPLPHFPTNQTSSALPPLCDGQSNDGWVTMETRLASSYRLSGALVSRGKEHRGLQEEETNV